MPIIHPIATQHNGDKWRNNEAIRRHSTAQREGEATNDGWMEECLQDVLLDLASLSGLRDRPEPA